MIPPRNDPAQSLAVTVDPEGAVHIDGGPEQVGLRPDFAGDLPKKARQDGVIDQDGDGEPGMTVQLQVPVFGAVEVYVVQRAHTILHGEPTPEGFAGAVEIRQLEQRTIGASNPFFKVSAPVTPSADKSRFTLTRLDEKVDCASAMKAR